MHFLRHACLISLILALSLSGAVMQARAGADPAVSQVVLCIDGTAQEVWVDADGNPAHAPHTCVHCALCAAITPEAMDTGWIATQIGVVLPVPVALQSPALTQQTALARGPPVFGI